MQGKLLNGQMMIQLCKQYIQAINTGGVPIIENAWNYICKNECVKAIQDAVKLFESGI